MEEEKLSGILNFVSEGLKKIEKAPETQSKRKKLNYKYHKSAFEIFPKTEEQQYANYYFKRLSTLRPLVKQSAQKHWGVKNTSTGQIMKYPDEILNAPTSVSPHSPNHHPKHPLSLNPKQTLNPMLNL